MSVTNRNKEPLCPIYYSQRTFFYLLEFPQNHLFGNFPLRPKTTFFVSCAILKAKQLLSLLGVSLRALSQYSHSFMNSLCAML
jgi:hypothetical protein